MENDVDSPESAKGEADDFSEEKSNEEEVH